MAPNGQQNNANCTQASGCGWPNPSDTDMKFADAVVAQIEQNFCVDTNRIFATGWSYGASMSEQTACERPLSGETNGWGVRAIAVYSVAYLSNTDNCKASSSKPVAYYASHGTNDTVLPYSGGRVDCPNLGRGGRLHRGDSYAGDWQSRLHQLHGLLSRVSGGVLLLRWSAHPGPDRFRRRDELGISERLDLPQPVLGDGPRTTRPGGTREAGRPARTSPWALARRRITGAGRT